MKEFFGGLLTGLTGIGLWLAWSIWVLVLLAACLAIFLGLPGGWVALGISTLVDLCFGFDLIGWKALLIFAGLLGLGELVESLLGTIYVAKKGATRYGMIGGFVGGLVGAFLGSGVAPVIGTLFGSFLGAFGGAVLGEYWRDERLEPSLRIGLHATIGKVLASTVKFALALSGAVLVAIRAMP